MIITDAKISLKQIALSDVKEIKIADTDLVINLRSGKRTVIKDGALRSMIDSKFKIQFTDKEIDGASLLRMAGKMEVSELSDVAVASAEQSNEDVLVSASDTATDSAASIGTAQDGVLGTPTTAAPEGIFATILKWAPTATIVGAVGAVAGALIGGGGGGGGSSGSTTTVIPPTVAPVVSKVNLTSASSDGVNATDTVSTDGVVSVIAASGAILSLLFSGPGGTLTREVAGLGADNPVLVMLTTEELAQLGQGNITVTGTTAAGLVLPKVNFLLDTIAPDVAEAKLNAMSDSGVKNDDLITSNNTLSFNVKGEMGATVKIYNDIDNNNQLDEGELIGQTTLNGSTQGIVDVNYLSQGQYNNLKVLQEDKVGNQSASTKLTDILIDNTAPNAQIKLNSKSDSGNNNDNITYNTIVSVTVSGEKGGQAVVFNDLNNNNRLDSGEELANFTMTADTQDISVNLHANEINRLHVVVSDAAGNKQESVQALVVTVDSSPPIFMEKTALLLSSGNSIDAMDNNTLVGSSRATETLTNNHFGLASDFPKNIVITFTNLTNVLIYKEGVLTNSATLEDILLNKITMAYTQNDANQQGVFARVDYTITQPSVKSEVEFKITDSLAFKSSENAMVIWGDGSGNGGYSSRYTSGFSGIGQNGGGSNDSIIGTSQSDLIFGDGSGGGGGRHPYNGNPTGNSKGGLGGGGDDYIDAGEGDDIIFGDGFSGLAATNGGAPNTIVGGGYGGGGGGGIYGNNPTGYLGGIGAGTGGTNSLMNSYTTLGPERRNASFNGGGGGVQKSSDINDYFAETDVGANNISTFNNSATVSGTVTDSRSQFLSGNGAMFTQDIGQGNDVINGGSGNDYIMAGGGNDTITGGRGSDIMYGRGGSGRFDGQNLSGINDNDVFVWKRGDATGGAVDVIRDFEIWDGANGDKLDLSQLLEGYNKDSSDVSQWIIDIRNNTTQADAMGWDAGKTGTAITIDVDGNGPGTNSQIIFLTNTNGLSTDIHTLISNGTIIV